MDKLIGFFIINAIIIALISEILPILAILAGIIAVIFIIYKLYQSIAEKRRINCESIQKMNSFFNALSSKTSIAYDEITDVESGKQYLENVFNDFVNANTIPPRIIHLFKELSSLMLRGLDKSTIWACPNVPKSLYEVSGSSLSRTEIKVTTEIPISAGLWNSLLHIVLSMDSGAIVVTPLFIIYIKGNIVTFFDWDKINVNTCNAIRIKEDTYSSIRGANALYHRYLHERVNGGPDRRYNYNPSWPVNQYTVIDLMFGKKQGTKVLGTILAGDIISKLEQFKKSLVINPIKYREQCSNARGKETLKDIKDIILSENIGKKEYASLFKKIIDERGKNILQERLFLSLLADFKVFREKKFLRPFLETMTDEGYWTELTEGNPSVDTLNRIKKKFITIHQYPEHEVTEAISYIGYGLGIIV